jgi:hypothetical protein
LLGAWVTRRPTGRPFPTAAEWRDSGLTTATFYDVSQADPAALSAAASWALARYPDGRLDRGPSHGERLLDAVQRPHAAHLAAIGFGDQDRYGPVLVDRLAAWFALAHAQHPDVVVHNIQALASWSQHELQSYVRTAKPDLVAFSSSDFSSADPYPDGGRPDIYDALNSYRLIALAGHDGTGRAPIAFGRLIESPSGGYVPSESELNFGYFAAWTMGARWTNLVGQGHDGFAFNRTPQSRQVARIAQQSRNMSPFLVRLSSSDVRIIPGRRRDAAGSVVRNARPVTIAQWDGYASPYLSAVEATGHGLAGDVLIGYFQRLPGLTPAAAAADLPADAGRLFTAKYVKPFMLLNGGISPNVADSAAGSGAATRQRVAVTLNRLGQRNRLVRVDRSTGRLEQIALQSGPGGTDRFTVALDGGTAELFFLTTGPTYDEPPYVTAATDCDAVQPGQTFTVHGTVANDSVGQPMPAVQARLIAPAGWSLQPDGSTPLGDLAAGESADTGWQVGIPADEGAGAYELVAETTYRYGPHTTVRGGARATAMVHIPYATLADAFTNIGIAANPGAADFDGGGVGYSARALAAAGLTPGSTVDSGGFGFEWPDVLSGSPDNVVCDGQAFSVGRSGRRLGFLGAGTNGVGGGTGTVLYTDGSLQPFELRLPDWSGPPPTGSAAVAAIRHGAAGGTVRLYQVSVDLVATKTVATVLLPRIGPAARAGIVAMHIFAMALD